MKKRILALVLSVAMVLGAVSFTAFADAAAGANYAAGEGAYYLLDVPEAGIGAENHTTSGTTEALPVVSENGEQFINFATPYQRDAENNLADYSSTIKVTNVTYGADAIPNSVVIGDGNAETTEDLLNTYIAVRLKVNDNKPAFAKEASSLTINIVTTSVVDETTGEVWKIPITAGSYTKLRWLDLTDGSMGYFRAQSGYNKNSSADRVDFTGDMDGYLLIPFSSITSSEGTITGLIKDTDLLNEFAGFEFYFWNAPKNEEDKASSWVDKQLLVGDMFIVNDAEKFATARSAKRGVAGQMYRPNVDDTAVYAARIGGYRSYAFLRGARSVSKAYQDPTEYNYSGQYDSYYHITTLPNGDRAYEFTVNFGSYNHNATAPNEIGTIYIQSGDTYDGENIGAAGNIIARAGIQNGNQGFTDEHANIVGLDKMTTVALRVATKDGTVENETVKFALRMTMSKTGSTGTLVNYPLQAGEITYFNINTGKAEKLTVDAESNITYTGNLDGYLIIPFTQFGEKFTLEEIKANWGGHVKSSYNHVAMLYMNDGWRNGKTLYVGDLLFVEDAAKFQEFHCPHANKATGAVVAPTCKEKGYTPVTCPDCGLVEKTAETDIIPCDKKIEEPAKAPTCKEPGYSAAKKCSMCGEISEMSAAIDPIAHDKNVDVPEVPATCKAAGTTAGKKCSMCGEVQEGCTVINTIAHDKLGGEVAGKAATCKEEGVEAAKKCSMCGEISEGGATIAKIACDKTIDVAEVPATCQKEGVAAGKKCSMCGEVQEGCTVIAKLAHDKNVTVDKVDATCTTEGATEGKKCSMCGEVQEGCEKIEKLAHELEKIETVAPTATEKGYDLLDCKNCDYTEKTNYVDALGSGDVDDDENNQGNEEDDENKSPETGDNNLFVMIMMIAALGAATVLFATKKRANR